MEGRFDTERGVVEKLFSVEDQTLGDEELTSILLQQQDDSFFSVMRDVGLCGSSGSLKGDRISQ
jgi:hypothetical protein